jgi:hypothetical protein
MLRARRRAEWDRTAWIAFHVAAASQNRTKSVSFAECNPYRE